MTRPSLQFLCDANTSVGFGHLSRCLQLAVRLRNSCAIAFDGRFSAEARERIESRGFAVGPRGGGQPRAVAVVDIMFDREDMDHYDLARLERIRKRFRRVVLLTSAMSVPSRLPVDVVVGHVLPRGQRASRRFRVLEGLAYAPVSDEFRKARGRRAPVRGEIRRVFAGFGASRTLRGLDRVLDGLESRGFAGRVDVLLSPFHRRFEEALLRRRPSLDLRTHSNVRSVARLLRGADVAFGTYGNITFEALCLGVPFLAVAVKDFQRVYAERLERRGLLVSLGRDTDLEARQVAAALARLTPEKRAALGRKGRAAVDGRGIERIRRVLERECRA